MCASPRFKPVGGIASVAVVPAGTAACGSAAGIEAAAVALPLAEWRSEYEERVDSRNGTPYVEHLLRVVVPAEYAHDNLDAGLLRRWALSGTAAVIGTESGERLLVGWSERMGSEQPLRLTAVEHLTGTSPRTIPATVLTFRCADASPAVRLSNL